MARGADDVGQLRPRSGSGPSTITPSPLSRPSWPTRPRIALLLDAATAAPSPTAGGPQERCTEAVMLAHDFTIEQMVALVRDGLAATTARRIVSGKNRFEVVALRIMDACRSHP